MRTTLTLIAVALLFSAECWAQCAGAGTQPVLQATGTTLGYREMLERLLPADVYGVNKSRFVFILRYLTTSSPESRIQISYDLDSVTRASFSQLEPSLLEVLSSSETRPAQERSKRLAEIRVTCRSGEVPVSVVRRWSSEFWLALADYITEAGRDNLDRLRNSSDRIVLDPAVYEINYTDELRSMRISVQVDPSIDPSKQARLVQWLNRIYSNVKELPERR